VKSLDTNILVRYYAQDDALQSPLALHLFSEEPSLEEVDSPELFLEKISIAKTREDWAEAWAMTHELSITVRSLPYNNYVNFYRAPAYLNLISLKKNQNDCAYKHINVYN
jgi:hypothetical protein